MSLVIVSTVAVAALVWVLAGDVLTVSAPTSEILRDAPPTRISWSTPGAGIALTEPTPSKSLIFLSNDGREVVRIDTATGAVTWQGTPDEASREFWRVLMRIYPQICPPR